MTPTRFPFSLRGKSFQHIFLHNNRHILLGNHFLLRERNSFPGLHQSNFGRSNQRLAFFFFSNSETKNWQKGIPLIKGEHPYSQSFIAGLFYFAPTISRGSKAAPAPQAQERVRHWERYTAHIEYVTKWVFKSMKQQTDDKEYDRLKNDCVFSPIQMDECFFFHPNEWFFGIICKEVLSL